MATQTPNYNLTKPDPNTDYYNIEVHNDNADIIDAALKPTADPALVPTGLSGKLTQWVSWITNRIKAITGKTNWYENPATTLEAAKAHADAEAPHTGHETPEGALAKANAAITAHKNESDPHAEYALDTELTALQGQVNEHKADLTPHLVPACFVYKSTAQSVAHSSYALLTFDVEKFDTHEMHDNSIDNSRITIPVDGKYLVVGSCSYASNATGYREAQLTVNGVAIRTTRQNAVSGVETEFTVEIVRDFTAGQYIQLLVRQNSGGALNLLDGLAFTTLSVIKIG